MITVVRLISNGKGGIREPKTGRTLNVDEATKFLVEAEEKTRNEIAAARKAKKRVPTTASSN